MAAAAYGHGHLMVYMEMARDENHGGGTWSFPNCVWAPTVTRSGASRIYWTKVGHIQEGDTIVHLRGTPPSALFLGFSRAAADGVATTQRPPDPKAWDHAPSYFRADLQDFVPFREPVALQDVFASRRDELEQYYEKNRARGKDKLQLFFVRQGGKIQCQNGGYLTDVDEELLDIIFRHQLSSYDSGESRGGSEVTTGSQVSEVRSRIGQGRFSEMIKRDYDYRCCFPGCGVTDRRFLIAAHIARWSDNPELRGHAGNGLCLCLVHDKAFELGLFSVDDEYCVRVNAHEPFDDSSVARDLHGCEGERIRPGRVDPLPQALREHRERVGFGMGSGT